MQGGRGAVVRCARVRRSPLAGRPAGRPAGEATGAAGATRALAALAAAARGCARWHRGAAVPRAPLGRTFVYLILPPSKIFSGLELDSCWQHTRQMHLKKRLRGGEEHR
jgi:hypothetical protein